MDRVPGGGLAGEIGGPAGAGKARTCALIGAALALMVAVVYLPAAGHDFVDLDDLLYVVDNPRVLRGLTAEGLAWALRSTEHANWHPLAWLSHMLDVQLFGLDAGRHHLTSGAIHLANTLLVFMVLRSATGATWRSGIVAALFAAHPLHVESVVWVAERKDVLCALFSLLALGAWVRHARRPSAGGYLAVAALFALALASKPMAVTFPFVLLLLDFWPLGRFASPSRGGGWSAAGRRAAALFAEKIPFLLLAAGSAAVTLAAQQQAGAVSAAFGPVTRLSNALVSWVLYLVKAAWPAHLSVFYPYAEQPPAKVLAALLLLATITAAALATVRRRPWLCVGWFWYLGTLVPVIGLVQVGGQAMADRYTYMPLLGIFVLAVWSVPAPTPGSRRSRAVAVVFLLVAVSLAAAARARVVVWADTVTLFEDAVKGTEDNWLAHATLGKALRDRGRTEEAVAHLEESLRLMPRYAEAHNNLGIALHRQGKAEAALERFSEAVRLNPGYAEARGNLAAVLAEQGRTEEARAAFLETLRLRPDYAKGHFNLGVFLERQGDRAGAAAAFRRALDLNPYLVLARRRLEALVGKSAGAAAPGR